MSVKKNCSHLHIKKTIPKQILQFAHLRTLREYKDDEKSHVKYLIKVLPPNFYSLYVLTVSY